MPIDTFGIATWRTWASGIIPECRQRAVRAVHDNENRPRRDGLPHSRFGGKAALRPPATLRHMATVRHVISRMKENFRSIRTKSKCLISEAGRRQIQPALDL